MSAGLVASLVAAPAGAEAKPGEAVLVLEAPADAGWKEGIQALVAELLTNGHELSVRAARSHSLDELEQELKLQVADTGASAGVSVTRAGSSATTVLCRRDATACERLEIDLADGELSRSRLALAVVERLRPLDLPAAAPKPPPAPPPPRVPPRAERPVVHEPVPKTVDRRRVWLGGGAVLSSGASAPLAWLGASFGLMLADPWGLEVAVGGTPLRGRAESAAGSLSLSGVQAVAFATFEPWSGPNSGLSLGLGGGALRLQEVASPASGFDGFSRHTTVGVLSARARLFQRLGPVYWGLSIDPGLLVPAVKVVAGTQTLLQLGRPWVSLQTSVGVAL